MRRLGGIFGRRALAAALVVQAWTLGAGCGDDGAGGPGEGDADALVDAEPDGEADADADGPDAATDDAADGVDGEVTEPPEDLVALVDVFVGTGSEGFNVGALQPGATTPFGMVRLTPNTVEAWGSKPSVMHAGGYKYEDPYVAGFAHIQLVGVGVADYGNLLMVPGVGDPAAHITEAGYRFDLDHGRESGEPGYYRIARKDDAFTAELTATPRVGVHRYTYAPTDEALVVLDITRGIGDGTALDSAVTVDPATGEISGVVHCYGEFTKRFDGFELFFVIRPDRAPAGVGVWDADGYVEGETSVGGPHAGIVLRYDATEDTDVEVQVGLSFVDVDGARANLEAEAAGRSFDDIRAEARATWADALSVVRVEGGTDTRRRLLYTALYHALLMPTLLTDLDGRYRGIDKQVYEAEGFTYYSDLSLWDTYRTFHPLITLLAPDRQRDFVASLGEMAKVYGKFPKWPLATGESGSMLGASADTVIADTVLTGLPGGLGVFDVEAAYQTMRASATLPTPEGAKPREHLAACLDHGYCPSDLMSGSVSRTLEYGANDYCLSRLAEHLGHGDDAAMFLLRSKSYQQHYEPTKGFLAPRQSDGSFVPFDPEATSAHYVEGTPWHYLFMVPFDVPGLVALLGGAEPFAAKLSTFLEGGRDNFSWVMPNAFYYHGNEPDIVAPWLFGFGDRPDLTRYWTTWVADNAYALTPGGLTGNDDGGTLSSWYVFAAAGLYPLPCTETYALSAPLFQRVTWRLDGGDFTVLLGEDPDAAPHIDGQPITGPTLARDLLVPGATLTLPPPPAAP